MFLSCPCLNFCTDPDSHPILLKTTRLTSENRKENLRVLIEVRYDVLGRHHALFAEVTVS